MSDILSQVPLFTVQPTVNNYPVISSIVAAQIPLANVFNGQSALVDLVNQMTANGTQTTNVQFSQIQQKFDFKMYKLVRPKVIFTTYLSRQLPDNLSSQSVYQQNVQFKIDYDPCCIGSMMLLLTLDISVRDSLGSIDVYGYSIGNNRDHVSISYNDVKSIQFAYGTDFIYHYIKTISLGWANTGGNSPIMHQEVPIEIAKIYHSLLVEPGMSETIKRMVREDMFVIGHDPNRQYGKFSFALKNPASIKEQTSVSGTNGFRFGIAQNMPSVAANYAAASSELAMYWNDTEITQIGYGPVTNNTGYSERRNIQATFKDPRSSGSTLTCTYGSGKTDNKIIKDLNLDTAMYWKFGTSSSEIYLTKNVQSAETEWYKFNLGQAEIHMTSDPASFIGGLSESELGKYPSTTINSTVNNDAISEEVYLIPVLQYDATQTNFKVLIYSKLTTGVAYTTYTASGKHYLKSYLGTATTLVIKENGQVSTQITLTASDMSEYLNTPVYVALSIDIPLTYNSSKYESNIAASTTIINLKSGTTQDAASGSSATAVTATITIPSSGTLINSYIISSEDGFSGEKTLTITDFVGQSSAEMGSYLLHANHAMSPLMMNANIGYLNLEVKPYEENDLALYSVDIYRVANGESFLPSGDNALAVYKYNSSLLANQSNEECYPAIKNVDGMSIHTYRKVHGIVDFYFPLQFLFICQGINTSFPHYACAAQSVIVKFQFCNPLAFINTSISVNPLALDPTDFSRKERILKNRVKPGDVLQSNTENMKFVLFYTKYVWVPQLNPVLAGYRYYNWITNNYEKIYKEVNAGSGNDIELAQFNKANFYTNIWMFFVNTETLYVDQNSGANLQLIPVNVNKYHLELWDTTRFQSGSSVTSEGASTVSLTDNKTAAEKNSVYYQTPIDRIQMVTQSSINMTDEIPYRAQLFAPYALYEHSGINSSLKFNNMLQMNIDSIFYQEGFPFCMYSPAYAPNFTIKAYLKSNSQNFGVIIIPQYKNVSYITKHVMLMKYQTNN